MRYYSRKAEVGKLNAHHSHFLLADDGVLGYEGAEVKLRRNLENYLSGRTKTTSAESSLGSPVNSATSDLNIPLVCVAIEGGVSLIRSLFDYLSEKPPVPVVICDGTGKAADIVAFAHRAYDERCAFSGLELQTHLLDCCPISEPKI